MSGAYFSGAQNVATFTADTQDELWNELKTAFLAASWTLEFEDATERELRSLASSISSNRCRVRLIKTGGNCLNVTLRTDDAVKISPSMFLLPGREFKTFINPYQYFILAPNQFIPRTFVAGGVVYIPSHHLGIINNALWAQGNGSTDTDTTYNICSFREILSTETGGVAWQCVNHLLHTTQAWSGSGTNGQGIFHLTGARGTGVFSAGDTSGGYTWADGSPFKDPPLIAWGPTSGGPHQVMGYLWDSLAITAEMDADAIYNFDSLNWWGLTNRASLDMSPNGEDKVFPGSLLLFHP